MKKTKRLLSLLLALIMVFSLMPTSAFANEDTLEDQIDLIVDPVEDPTVDPIIEEAEEPEETEQSALLGVNCTPFVRQVW